MDLEDDGPRRGTIRVRVKNREKSLSTRMRVIQTDCCLDSSSTYTTLCHFLFYPI